MDYRFSKNINWYKSPVYKRKHNKKKKTDISVNSLSRRYSTKRVSHVRRNVFLLKFAIMMFLNFKTNSSATVEILLRMFIMNRPQDSH